MNNFDSRAFSRLFFLVSMLFAVVCLIQEPVYARSMSSESLHFIKIFGAISEFTGILFFYLFVVYLAGAGFSFARLKIQEALTYSGIAALSIGIMWLLPKFLELVSYSGFQYSVKISVEFATISVCAILALGLLTLPSILTIATKERSLPQMIFMNLIGIVIFPIFVIALQMVSISFPKKARAEEAKSEDSKE